jgi:hypothetical protein
MMCASQSKLIHAIFDKRTPKSHENHPQPKAAACTGVEDSLCLRKAYEKREKGGRVKPLPHRPCGT